MGTQLCPGDVQPRDPVVAETPLAKPPVSGRSLLPLCFPNSRGRVCLGSGRCALPRERSWRLAGVSSGVYPLLSYKRGIVTPAPPLPSDQDPKITISSWPVNH